jgi:hypothetical protein
MRSAFFILILFSLMAGSCSSRKNKLDRSGLIPEKDLISILTDIHLADGLLTITNVRHWVPSYDTLSTYYHIIEKHGYTKETMDKTMKYYFIKNPKKLISIYDQVLGILSEMESYLDKESAIADARRGNLWPGRDFYYLPGPAGLNETGFEIKLNLPGVYTLKYTATLFPDDQAINPRITAFSCHPDSIDTGKRDYVRTLNYIKDGQPHNYTVIFKVPANTILYIRGRLYDLDNHIDYWGNHAIFENISLVFTQAFV